MNGIIGMVDLLEETQVTKLQKDYTGTLSSSANNLLSIVNDVLDFSKIEAGKLELESVPFNLRQLVEQVQSLFNIIASEKTLLLQTDYGADVPDTFYGDPVRIRQVLNNLIGNAIKFTDAGRVTVRVLLQKESSHDSTLRFEVEDTGIGISEEEANLIFEKFTQADNSVTRRFGGTGLGLSISRQLIDLMGGELGVASIKGKGALFHFTLTLAKTESASLESVQPGPANNDPDLQFDADVLLVEDNRVNQLVAKTVLQKMGLRVTLAENGRDALECYQNGKFDIILMDASMPVMDGFEATREIRLLEEDGHHLPIIALTALVMDGDRERCLEAGMDGHVSKPINREALQSVLKQYLPYTRADTTPPLIGAEIDEKPVLLREQLELATDGDPELIDEIVAITLQDLRTRTKEFKQAQRDKNLDDCERLAHSITGIAANVGGVQVELLARVLQEEAGHHNKLPDKAAVKELEDAIARLLEALQSMTNSGNLQDTL
jgi:CheY-like chemotaxis protein/HPt (histidine-containing phosphotransfer) domain-containing protein